MPRVSVTVAAYEARATIERCLVSLRAQSFRDFEVILVDSSPNDATAEVVARFPEVQFHHSATRLYPHEARNLATSHARGELLVTMDADVYPHPDWLDELVREYDASHEVIVGAIACHGPKLRDVAMQFCKFAKFLPAGEPRTIDTAPTANLLVARADFERAGGLRGDRYIADVTLGRDLMALGRQLRFAPRAIVDHHHTQSARAFLRERFLRGRIFGELRSTWLAPRSMALLLVATVVPVRLARVAMLTLRYAMNARMTGAFLLASPLTLAGHAASLAGESVAYAEALVRFLARRPRSRNSGAAAVRTTR